jgi:hypothetical protein
MVLILELPRGLTTLSVGRLSRSTFTTQPRTLLLETKLRHQKHEEVSEFSNSDFDEASFEVNVKMIK